MIPAAYITDWGNTVRRPTIEQIEQDHVCPARSSRSPKGRFRHRSECTAGAAVRACDTAAIIVLH